MTDADAKTNRLVSKAHGCLMGVALGDALGMPSSMMDAENIRELFPDGIRDFLPPPEGHPLHTGMVAGQVTDDTEQTLVLADAYLKDGKFVPMTVAQGLIAWAEKVNGFDSMYLGPSTLRALRMIRDGGSIEKAGFIGDTNGAAMRIGSVGIVNAGDLKGAVNDTATVCLPTHNTNLAISGAAAIACAVAAAMDGASLNEINEAFFYGAREGVKRGNRWIGASVERRGKLALEIAAKAPDEATFWQDLYDIIGTTVVMAEAVPAALAINNYYKFDPVEVARCTANMGGDCDTIGAIAGAMAGAYAGIEAFPSEVIQKIEEVNNLHLDEYARRLIEVSSKA